MDNLVYLLEFMMMMMMIGREGSEVKCSEV